MEIVLGKEKRRQAVPSGELGIVVGVDVSKGRIDFAAVRPGEWSKTYTVRQDGEGYEHFDRWLGELKERGYEVWVAFEPTGPYSTCLGEWLLEKGYRAVQVNPYHVKRTKEVRDNSPLKSDGKDTLVIAGLVWQGCYRELLGLQGVYAELRAATTNWDSLAKERTRLRNEFQALLEVWFPELGDLFKDKACKTVRAIVSHYESSKQIAAARLSSLRTVIRKASLGRVSPGKAEEIRRLARESISISHGQRERQRHMSRLLLRLEEVEEEQRELKQRLEELLLELPEARHMLSVPYVGIITVAGLLGECGDLRRFPSCEALEKFLGLNLYEVSSGQHKGKHHISKRGRSQGRYLACQAATLQMKRGALYHDFYQERKAKGQSPNSSRVAIARKLLALLYAIARDRQPFDRERFNRARAGDDRPAHQGMQAKAA